MSRTPLIAGNWKMYKTVAEAERYIQALLPRVASLEGVEIAICTPFTTLHAMVESARGSRVAVYAQNMHEAPDGAFTGEVSAPMLVELDVAGVVLGHSERRQYFDESCVGETEEERLAGDTERKLRHQVHEGLERVPKARLHEVAIAYEPIWAIGTGQVATPEQAQETASFVRALAGALHKGVGEHVRVLYGGSVNPGNAAELLALPDVDGALVGGASLEAESFAAIAGAARGAR
jgi:triosephosphate isomerase